MCWYTKYFEDQGQLLLYKRETIKKFDGLISDLENCEAEAICHMLDILEKKKPPRPPNPNGFLFVMFKNALVDIHRKKFGRPRAPSPMKREGKVISKIFPLYCLNKKTADEIAVSLMVHIDIVRKWTSWLSEKNKCPSRPQIVSMDSAGSEGAGLSETLYDVDEPDPTAHQVTHSEDSQVLDILRDLLRQPDAASEQLAGNHATSVIQKLREQMILSDEQIILLSMRFVEGMTVSAAARELNLSRKAFEKQEQAVLSQLHEVFITLGIER